MTPFEHGAWFANAGSARSYLCPFSDHARCDPLHVHCQLPSYSQTPLVELPDVSKELKVGKVFIKDESSRLGLPAFKILGASYATFLALCDRFSLNPSNTTLANLRSRCSTAPVTLYTATDGNHGRAVSRIAKLLGITAEIVIPANVSEVSRSLIASEGSSVERIDGDYDAAVERTIEKAREAGDGAMVIQDSSWEGYAKVPVDISFGYSTFFKEVDEQLASMSLPPPDLIVLPVGVGSLAHSSIIFYRSPSRTSRPAILTVEPTTAACLLTSFRAGEHTSISTGQTIMPGLCCGTVSPIAWPDLRGGISASVAVEDDVVARAVEELAADGRVLAGPCGAATLVALRTIDTEGKRMHLGVKEDSVVVLISTEGSEVYLKGLHESNSK